MNAGDRVERYEIERLLGEGGMASVFLARHMVLGSMHAIKILHSHFVAKAEIRERFIAEGRIQAQLRHPHIVNCTDVVADGEVAGLVMEYLKGPTLASYLNVVAGPLPLRSILGIMIPMLNAVGYAHRQGVVHRDLKPANIILAITPRGTLRPVVLDFGVAKLKEDAAILHQKQHRTQTGLRMGTPHYMSPEQIRGLEEVDHRADIFALGSILFEMATGKVAFAGNSEYDIMRQIAEGTWRFPAQWARRRHPALVTSVEKAVRPNPNDRFQDCASFAQALYAAAKDPEAKKDKLPRDLNLGWLQPEELEFEEGPETKVPVFELVDPELYYTDPEAFGSGALYAHDPDAAAREQGRSPADAEASLDADAADPDLIGEVLFKAEPLILVPEPGSEPVEDEVPLDCQSEPEPEPAIDYAVTVDFEEVTGPVAPADDDPDIEPVEGLYAPEDILLDIDSEMAPVDDDSGEIDMQFSAEMAEETGEEMQPVSEPVADPLAVLDDSAVHGFRAITNAEMGAELLAAESEDKGDGDGDEASDPNAAGGPTGGRPVILEPARPYKEPFYKSKMVRRVTLAGGALLFIGLALVGLKFMSAIQAGGEASSLLTRFMTDPVANTNPRALARAQDKARTALDAMDTAENRGQYALALVWAQGWHLPGMQFNEDLFAEANAATLAAVERPTPDGYLARAILASAAWSLLPLTDSRREPLYAESDEVFQQAEDSLISDQRTWLRFEMWWSLAAHDHRRATEALRAGNRDVEEWAWKAVQATCDKARPDLPSSPVNDQRLARECIQASGFLQDYISMVDWARWLRADEEAASGEISVDNLNVLYRSPLPACGTMKAIWSRKRGGAFPEVTNPIEGFCNAAALMALGCEVKSDKAVAEWKPLDPTLAWSAIEASRPKTPLTCYYGSK